MKRYLSILAAGAALLCVIFAFGCGTGNDTQNSTTRATTAESTTERTTEKSTSEKTEQSTTSAVTDESTLDPTLPIPDLDNPMTDIEPNVPDGDIGGNGSEGALDPFGGMGDGSMNNGENGARSSGRTNTHITPSARPNR